MKQTSRQRKTRSVVIVILLVVAIVGTLAAQRMLTTPDAQPGASAQAIETAEAAQGTVSVRVDATAVAEPYLLRTIRAANPGTVVSIVEEGTMVPSGAPLVRFDTTALDRQVVLAGIVLREAELTKERNEETLQRSFNALKEREELLQTGAVPREQVTAARDQVTSAQFALRAAELAVDKARVALETTHQALTDAAIRAPFDGTVLTVSVSVGDWIGQNVVLLTFGDVSRLRFRAEVDEYDVALVEVGLPVIIRSDSIGDRVLQATVESISPEATIVSNISVFRVTAASGSAGGSLKPGMSADLSIQLAEDSGLVIPARAVSTVRNRSYVDVVSGEEVETRRVEVGANDGSSIVVLSGLEIGEKVKLPDRSGILPTSVAAPAAPATGTSIIPMSIPGGGGGGGGGGGTP